MVTAVEGDAARAVMAALERVPDPEIPEISIVDLGIIRGVERGAEGGWRVSITPTYSGCPAYETICRDMRDALEGAGFAPVEIVKELFPPWTTDWMSDRARAVLKEIGIAPPGPAAAGDAKPILFFSDAPVTCPRCGSGETELMSRFGATACKSMHRCLDCLEPFEHFKAI